MLKFINAVNVVWEILLIHAPSSSAETKSFLTSWNRTKKFVSDYSKIHHVSKGVDNSQFCDITSEGLGKIVIFWCCHPIRRDLKGIVSCYTYHNFFTVLVFSLDFVSQWWHHHPVRSLAIGTFSLQLLTDNLIQRGTLNSLGYN